MSQFIGFSTNGLNLVSADDRRLAMQSHQPNQPNLQVTEFADRGFRTPWWPRSGFEGDDGVDGFVRCAVWHQQPELSSGSISRVGYRGVTRDANNSPVGGVTVKCFRTADDTKTADDVVSDANGNFIITTPYYEPHYLVMRKTGTPDIGGVTVSTQYPNT